MDTLKYVIKLEQVGFTREQAEMTLAIYNEVIESQLATKLDLKDLNAELRREMIVLRTEINDLRVEMRHEFSKIRYEMNQLKSDLTVKLGGIMVAGIAVISAIVSLR